MKTLPNDVTRCMNDVCPMRSTCARNQARKADHKNNARFLPSHKFNPRLPNADDQHDHPFDCNHYIAV